MRRQNLQRPKRRDDTQSSLPSSDKPCYDCLMKLLFLASILVFLAGICNAATFVYVSESKDKKIAVFSLDEKNGDLTRVGEIEMSGAPGCLALSPDRKKIYASIRTGPEFATLEIDPETGYVMDMKVLKVLIKEKIEDAFDHKNLNEEVPEFLDLIPTAENMAVVIYQKLIPHLNNKHDLSVTLYETPRNYVTFSG